MVPKYRYLPLLLASSLLIVLSSAKQDGVVSSCEPIVFLQKTHTLTPRLLASAILAKQQVEKCGGYYRVLFTVLNDKQIDRNKHALASLRSALGNRTVLVVGPAQFSAAFAVSWKQIQKFPVHWSIGRSRCDAPEISWYHHYSHEIPSTIKSIWVAEYDVAWTGNLPHTLSVFPPDADLVCFLDNMKMYNGTNWLFFKSRNWLENHEVRRCFIMLVRYSQKLLDTILRETQAGHMQYCEMTAPSICEKQKTWCKTLVFANKHPIVGRDKMGTPLFRWNVRIDQNQWLDIVAGAQLGHHGHLYHALKW